MWVGYHRKKALHTGLIVFDLNKHHTLKVLFLFQSSQHQISYHKIWLQRHRIPVKPSDFMIYIKSWSGFYLLFLSFPFSIIYFTILFIYSTTMNVFPLFTSDTPVWYHVYSPPLESSSLTPHLWFKVSHLKESLWFVALWVPCTPSGRWVWLPWAHSALCLRADPTRLNSVSSPPWACHALPSEWKEEIQWLNYLGRQIGFRCGSGRCLSHHPAQDQPL